MQVTAAQGADEAREAAAIWARAKARRDREPEPATVEETLPGIRRRLTIDGARLFLARRDGRPVGFTLVAPRPQTLEIFYLAVDPDAWGSGVASPLLLRADDHAREIGRRTLELWVIDDNERAIHVYQRSGWVGTDEVQRDASSGRLERRFLRHIVRRPLDGLAAAGSQDGPSDRRP
jgi:RimJ/RimL family protein N-acetyltransferase